MILRELDPEAKHELMVYDVNAACSGFMYALSIADKFIRCGESRKALVCGSETLSQITNWNHK